jgi:hypothetical protein
VDGYYSSSRETGQILTDVIPLRSPQARALYQPARPSDDIDTVLDPSGEVRQAEFRERVSGTVLSLYLALISWFILVEGKGWL